MKVLLAPIGSRGDIQPQLVLAHELKRRGHEVMFATCPNFQRLLRAEGFDVLAIGRDSDVTIRENASLAEQNPVFALPKQLQMITRETEQQCSDLLSAELPQFDVVVGAGLSFASHLLAERQGARYAFVCYSLSGMQSAAHPPATIPIFGLPEFANRALWGIVRSAFASSVGGVLKRARATYGLRPEADSWSRIHYTNVILAQDSVMGTLPHDVPGNIVHVPALAKSPGPTALPSEVEAFLERRSNERLVYVGFGSMPTMERSRVVAAVAAFCRAQSVRALLFSSHNEDTALELPDSILSVGSLDHTRLFPRVDLVVHHGGAGTTAAALRAGVPQMIVPHIVDQFFHARRIAELGVGPAPVKKRALKARLLGVSWADVEQQRLRAAALALTLAPSGASAAAEYLEALSAR
jgi:UDP:flavonoid glycosyltransferase YjiC (YdhE family)